VFKPVLFRVPPPLFLASRTPQCVLPWLAVDHDSRYSCNATNALSLRLCPCIERDLEEEHRLELAGIIEQERALQREEMERLHALSAGVQQLLAQYNVTKVCVVGVVALVEGSA